MQVVAQIIADIRLTFERYFDPRYERHVPSTALIAKYLLCQRRQLQQSTVLIVGAERFDTSLLHLLSKQRNQRLISVFNEWARVGRLSVRTCVCLSVWQCC